jgi:hypothetical protein
MRFCTRLYLILLLFASVPAILDAQTDKKKPSGKFSQHLGFGANLGNIRFSNYTFQFGLSPNIAYRLGESTAVGIMLRLDYYYERFPEYGNQKFSAFDIGPAAFIRWKPLWTMDGVTPFLKGIFLQAEYERASIARPFLDGNLRVFTMRESENYLYLGLGASSGFPFATHISIHYNVLDDINASRIPFDYRFGFTYNY